MPATLEIERPQTRPTVRRAPLPVPPAPAETPNSNQLVTSVSTQRGNRRPRVSFSPVKLFTWFGFAVACGLVTAFGLDLVFGWPFWRASVLFDATFVACGLGLAWLSWNVRRDQVRGRY